MKKLYLFLILCACCLTSSAWAQKNYRTIFIWDVTQSMVDNGIDKVVPDFIINTVKATQLENTEVIVIPFQDSVLTRYVMREQTLTDDAKKRLEKKIKEIGPLCMKHTKHRKTNIIDPINYAIDTYKKNDRENTLYLLTDGKEEHYGGDATSEEKKAEALANFLKTLAFDSATMSESDILYYIQAHGKLPITPGEVKGGQVEIRDTTVIWNKNVNVEPYVSTSYKLKDKNEVTIYFRIKDTELPSNTRVRVQSEPGAPIHVDETRVVVDNKVTFTPQYDYETLKASLAENSSMNLNVTLVNGNELQMNHQTIVHIVPDKVSLTLINQKYRVMKIKMVK